MQNKRIKHGDNVKPDIYLRDILVEMMLYCHGHLGLNNADIGRIFRRDRATVKRIIDKARPKRATKR